MNALRSLRIGTRLAAAFIVLLLLLFTVAASSLSRLSKLASSTENIVEIQVQRAFLAQESSQHAQLAANTLLKLLQTSERKRRIPLYAQMDSQLASSDLAVAKVSQTLRTTADHAQLAHLNVLRNNYDDFFRATVETLELAGPARARAHFEAKTQKALDAFLAETNMLAAIEKKRMNADLAALKSAESGAQTLVIFLSFCALLTGSGFAWVITRSITGPVSVAVGVAQSIARGELNKTVPADTDDEVGQLFRAMEIMRNSIVMREDKILKLAYLDPLTGLANRTHFLEAFNTQTVGSTGAILVLDIDRFALINHALGYAVGDQLLRELGQRLDHLAGEHTLVARLWGNEFAMLLSGIDQATLHAFIESVQDLLRQPLTLEGQRLDVSGTLGIARYPHANTDGPGLLRKATLAMRWAKARRIGVAFTEEAGDEPVPAHLSLLGEMRDALARQEFVVYYQPKLNIAQQQTHAAEALLRWQHPEQGLIPPGSFIPFAEQTGFIREITPWLLANVIAQTAVWLRAGVHIMSSVNLSAYDLLNPSLVDYIHALLEQHVLPAQHLCLEITESALMEDPEIALKHLNQLSALGIKLSIDDYGTGQASLAYLKTLPVNELKIDRAFIADIHISPKNSAIVRSTILLCHELGLTVVAEGAETTEELAWLNTSGCDMIQGYGIAKPMPPDVFLAWLKQDAQ